MDLESRFIFIYLITNPHAHYSGLYYMPLETIALETDIKINEVRKGIDTLSKNNFIRYDNKVSIVWVVNMLKYQGHGSLQLTGAANHFKTLHNTELIKLCIEYYKTLNIHIPYQYRIDTLLDTLSKGVHTVEVPVSEALPEEIPVSEEESAYIQVFDFWNYQGIITHKNLSDKAKGKINALLAAGYTTEELLTSIENYSIIISGPEYYFGYKWELADFLQRGFEKFKDLAIAKQNFKRSKINGESKPKLGYESNPGKYDNIKGIIQISQNVLYRMVNVSVVRF